MSTTIAFGEIADKPELRSVIRDQVVIGTLDLRDCVVTLDVPAPKAVKAQITKHAASLDIIIADFVVQGADEQEQPGGDEQPPVVEQPPAAASDPVPFVFPPECPPMGKMGDLTPEVIEWIKNNAPEEYTRRYLRPGHPKGPRGQHN